jgi:hypothetical protein
MEKSMKAFWVRFFADNDASVIWKDNLENRFFCSGYHGEIALMAVLVHTDKREKIEVNIKEYYPEAEIYLMEEVNDLKWKPGNMFPDMQPLVI